MRNNGFKMSENRIPKIRKPLRDVTKRLKNRKYNKEYSE